MAITSQVLRRSTIPIGRCCSASLRFTTCALYSRIALSSPYYQPMPHRPDDGPDAFYAATVQDWRDWLDQNGGSARSVRLIVYNARSGIPSAAWNDVIEHALCYGWVDSKAVTRDHDSVYLTFTSRNPKSTWGRKNRARAQSMIDRGLMAPAGQRLIDLARQSGTWDALTEAQDGIVPEDLQQQFAARPEAARHFAAFPPSSRTLILQWIATAKKPETRRKRIDETVHLAAQNRRAHHY